MRVGVAEGRRRADGIKPLPVQVRTMLESRGRRVLAVAVLLGVLGSLAVGFGTVAPDPRSNHFLDESDLATGGDAHVGQRTQVEGVVVRTDPVVVRTPYSVWEDDHYETGAVELRVTDLDRSVQRGDSLQVFGVVEADRTVRATDSVAVSATNFRYMYGVSLLAGLWVLARLVRGWTVDWEELALRRRVSGRTRDRRRSADRRGRDA